MARRPPRTLSELLIGVVGAILVSGIMYVGAVYTIGRLGQQTQENIARIQQSALVKQQVKAPLPKQAPDPYEAQVAKIAAESKRRHDEAWGSYYKPKAGCDVWQSDAHMVECVNHKMRSKDEFERQWVNAAKPSL